MQLRLKHHKYVRTYICTYIRATGGGNSSGIKWSSFMNGKEAAKQLQGAIGVKNESEML